jgi:glycosyltransferase involved in cell wall biosynthesis
MNILQICANYPPVASGYGVYAQNLSLGLLKKGISDLIRVFSEIENDYDVKLWIVGNGPDELKFRRLVQAKFRRLVQALQIKNIEFLGFREDIANILSMTNIFVNPSHYDSVPTTVLEAGCLGKRVVATNVGDIPI